MTADEEDIPVMNETMRSATGRLVLKPIGNDVSEVTAGELENGRRRSRACRARRTC